MFSQISFNNLLSVNFKNRKSQFFFFFNINLFCIRIIIFIPFISQTLIEIEIHFEELVTDSFGHFYLLCSVIY